jgi:uroporphyrinogen decarboxylase
MTGRERFINVMDYKPVDRVPNHELAVWEQTKDRWEAEGLDMRNLHWDWFTGEEYFSMDPKEYINVNFGMLPMFEREVLAKEDRHEIIRHENGVVTKVLTEGVSRGMRSSMDQYLRFPVETIDDFRDLKKRYVSSNSGRYPAQWKELMLPRWKNREHVLCLGRNCSMLGFYWRAREWMGTVNLSYALYDEPALIHEMMEFIADFTIEVSDPILKETDVDFVMINEDMSMKNGPLLSPQQYKTYIYPHMKRLVDYLKQNGVRYVFVDTDGNPDQLLPMLMACGVDGIIPLERAAGADPVAIRKKYGRDLRLWGGVDKRILAEGPAAIDMHLAEMVPLIEEGGFIPTVDHAVSPDISLENFRYYIKRKLDLLSGRF